MKLKNRIRLPGDPPPRRLRMRKNSVLRFFWLGLRVRRWLRSRLLRTGKSGEQTQQCQPAEDPRSY